MIMVLKATQEQYDNLNGYTYNLNYLIFKKDADDNWIVGEDNIDNPNFIAIKSELNQLERIPYNPKPDNP